MRLSPGWSALVPALRARTIVACLLAMVLLALLPHAAAADQPSTQIYTGGYSGSLSYKDVLPEGVTFYGAPLAGVTITESLSWTVKVRDEYRDGQLIAGSDRQAAQGTVAFTCTGGDSSCQDAGCTAHAAQSSPSVKSAAGLVGPGSDVREHPDAVSADFGIPNLTYDDQNSGFCPTLNLPEGWTSSNSTCTNLGLSGDDLTTFDDAFSNAEIETNGGGGAHNLDVSRSDTAPCDGTTETQSITLSATATANGGAAPAHKPKPTNNDAERKKEKDDAKQDLRDQLALTALPCGASALGATGLIWGVTVPGVGGAALIPATLIGSYYGPMCGYLISRIHDDARIVHDPPSGDDGVIARVAPTHVANVANSACRSHRGANRAFCEQVAAKLATYATAVGHATAVDTAIVTTIDRQTGALKTGDAAALAKQNARGGQLEATYRTALTAEAHDGRALAGLIAAHHITAHLSIAQDRQAIDATDSKLNQHRQTTQRALAKLLGARTLSAAETPKAHNLLALLR